MFRTAKPETPPPRRRLRRILLGFTGLLFLLAVAVWLAPTFIAKSGLRDRIARNIFSDLDGTLHIGSASLGWFSPVVLNDVELRDPEGRIILFAPRMVSAKTLFDLLCDTSAPGCFRCERARFHVVSEHHKTNAEVVFKCWIEPDSEPSDSIDGIGVELEVVEGSVDFHDKDLARQWRVDDVQLRLALPRYWTTPMTLALTGKLNEAGDNIKPVPAPIALEMSYGLRERAGKLAGAGRVKLDLDKVPAVLADTVLRRFESDLQVTGQVGGHAELAWGDTLHAEGKLAGTRLTVGSGPLGRDELRLDSLSVPFKVDNAGNRWTFADTGFQCDVGSASLTGTIDLHQGLLAALKQARGEMSAQVDFARLAAMLPRTLHLQEGLEVKSGKVNVALASKPGDKGQAWTGSIKTSDLQAEVNGMPMSWPEPIGVDFAARESTGELVVDKLECRSDFLTLDAKGTAAQFSGRARFDLDRLMLAVTRFVDVGTLICSGAGEASLDFRHESGKFTGQATCGVRGFALSGWTLRPWREEQLSFRLDASGTGNPLAVASGAKVRLDQAHAQVTAGETWAEAKLLEPVDPFAAVPLFCTFRARGDLAAWKQRLRPWTAALDDMQLSGAGELTGILRRGANSYKVEDGLFTVNNLRVRAFDMVVAEPTAEARLNATWQDGQLVLEKSELNTPTVSAKELQARLQFPVNAPMTCTGKTTLAGDVQRVLRLLQPATLTPLTGNVNGTLAWQWTGPLELQLDLTGNNLVYGPRNQPTWQEAKPHLVCFASYDAVADALTLRRLEVQSSMAGCIGQGRIDKLSTRCDLNLTGQLQYDMAQVNKYLQPRLGNQVTLVGKDARPFRLEGSLAAAHSVSPSNAPRVVLGPPNSKLPPAAGMNLRGDASLALQSATIYGFQLGALTADAHLEDGWIRFKPIASTLNQGKLNVTPSVRLEPTEVYLAQGRILERVRITPEMLAGGLGFVAPALANALEPQGSFTVDLDDGRVPLDNVNATTLAGKLSVHQLQVNSSPLIGELGRLLNLPGTVQVKPESVVPFRVTNGRVFHDNLELLFGNVVVKTSGSVGLDGTLALTASVPIPKHMLGSGVAATALAKRTVNVPIRGTLERPKLDERAFLQETQKLIRDSARDVLREEAEKGLQRLFGR
ncbi:MAG: hypothetical protein AB7K24_03335 [Gemmataceae bacterium]